MKLETISMGKVKPNPMQPRESFSKESIKELADSINAQGLLQPIVVRPKDNNFEIIAGERRWRAFSHLKKKDIPAIVWKIDDDVEVAMKSLIENWEREDLTPVERENMVTQIYESGHFSSAEELGKALGLSGQTIKQYIKVKKDRDRLGVATPKITTRDIQMTTGLDDDTRKWMLTKMEKGEISKHEPEKDVRVLKSIPEPVRNAVVKEEIDLEDVKPRAEVGIPEELAEPLVQELKKEKKIKEQYEKAELEQDKAVLKGELKAKEWKFDISVDEKRLKKYEELWKQFKFLSPAHINMIETPRLREKAIEYIKDIRDFCDNLLSQFRGGG